MRKSASGKLGSEWPNKFQRGSDSKTHQTKLWMYWTVTVSRIRILGTTVWHVYLITARNAARALLRDMAFLAHFQQPRFNNSNSNSSPSTTSKSRTAPTRWCCYNPSSGAWSGCYCKCAVSGGTSSPTSSSLLSRSNCRRKWCSP